MSRQTTEQKRRNPEPTGSGTARHGGHGWTAAEDRKVLAHTIPDRELALELGRSLQAIQTRRYNLRLIGPVEPWSLEETG